MIISRNLVRHRHGISLQLKVSSDDTVILKKRETDRGKKEDD